MDIEKKLFYEHQGVLCCWWVLDVEDIITSNHSSHSLEKGGSLQNDILLGYHEVLLSFTWLAKPEDVRGGKICAPHKVIQVICRLSRIAISDK